MMRVDILMRDRSSADGFRTRTWVVRVVVRDQCWYSGAHAELGGAERTAQALRDIVAALHLDGVEAADGARLGCICRGAT